MKTNEEWDWLTEKIIGCAFKVTNALGAGFLEKVYENALSIELERAGLTVERQKPLQVLYEGFIVGEYYADIVVNEVVLLELKATRNLDPAHQAQLIHYLRATGLRIGLLLNFGTPRLTVKRMVN